MPKRYRVHLTDDETDILKKLLASRKSQSVFVRRAYILLALDENQAAGRLSDEEIRLRYQVGQRSIERTRQRFIEEGFQVAVHGKKRTVFKERKFDGRVEARLIAMRCQSPPLGVQAWTLRLLAEQLVELAVVEEISHESVRQLLKKTN
jgi:transposase